MDLRTAADSLGVHYQTAYRWVRDGSLRAVKIGAVYHVDDAELERFQEWRSRPAPPPQRAQVRSWDLQVQRLRQLLVEGDELGCRQAVDRLRDGAIEPLELCEELFTPALRGVGDDWEHGKITVAEEHRASEIVDRLLARVAVHPRGRPRGCAVVATVPGEEHGLPAAMAAIVLRADRWQVHHLGTQVPPEELIALARDERAQIVVLPSCYDAAVPTTEEVGHQVRAAGFTALVGHPGDCLRDLLTQARDGRHQR